MSALPIGWAALPVCDAVYNVPLTGKKIPQKQYLEKGKHPVIDQGQSLVGGFTDDSDAIVSMGTPVIVFGDHTKVVKLVKFSFAPGADGIKVLKPHAFFGCLLFKYFLDHITAGLIDKGYARHYQHLAIRVIPVPPLDEQHRIVAKIEELFSELDAGVASLKQARAQLAVYRQALLKHAFEGKLTERWRAANAVQLKSGDYRNDQKGHPDGWCWSSVSDVGDISTGTTPATNTPAYYGGDFAFFKPTDLDQAVNVRSAREHLTELGKQQSRLLSKGTTMVTCIGATIGKSGLARVDCATNQQINSISPTDAFIPEFIYYQVIGPRFQDEIKSNASSTTLPILNKSKFSRLPLAVCPKLEQAEIVRILDHQCSAISVQETDIDQNLQRAEALRQSILKKAFAGELVPQDPSDEPASALLARIQAERVAQAAAVAVAKTAKPRKIKAS